jgi:amino acid transporter/nucleotide-binding universal stress UspA family protein
MSTTEGTPVPPGGLMRRLARPAQVIIVSSVMFTFISYWRTAAVVLCDLASTVYYIGGIVENAIGPAAPWFILAVMVFSYAVRSVYIESCSLFVRGGVYRVVKEAMGGFLAKLSVSALMFDYVLTGPTSGVSAGQYIMGLVLQFVRLAFFSGVAADQLPDFLLTDEGHAGEKLQRWGSVILAVAVTLYFFRQNLLGIHESSGKALKIMYATTVMALVIIGWCLITLLVNRGPAQWVPLLPDLQAKVEHEEVPAERADDPARYNPQQEDTVWVRDPGRPDRLKPKEEDGRPVPKENEAIKEIANVTGLNVHKPDDPLGFLASTGLGDALRRVGTPGGPSWLSLIGVLGLFLAFGHSILAMSGEETLAQVYREVESPKLKNFKRAAFIVFVYSVVLTAGISFLAVLIIPDEVRMKFYSGNLISGLARHVIGPPLLKLALETFVVVIGFLILSGAVNTAIIGSNGVLNRIAEDGVLPDWFLKPHPRYGTTYRLLVLITSMQIGVILISMGHIVVLGEAYAFGVVWSFVFKALSMVVLRFKDRTPREYKVPLNVRVRGVEIPIGLILIFLVLLTAAVLNFFTKEVATVSGLVFTAGFLTVFVLSERYHEKRRGPAAHKHMEQFNREQAADVSLETLGITKPYRKLVAIRSTQNLVMLEKALNEADPDTTAVIVMTAKVMPAGDSPNGGAVDLDAYDQQLLTAVVDKAEHAGKQVKPLIVPTNNPLNAVLQTADKLQANEVIMGASNKYTADEQLEQIAFYWINLHHGTPAPLTVRVLGADRDMALDLGGGNRIPKVSERRARNVAELRAAGVGVDRVLMLHDGTPESSDLFQDVLTLLDPQVVLALAPVAPGQPAPTGLNLLPHDQERAKQLGRTVSVLDLPKDTGEEIVRVAKEGQFDLIVLALPSEPLPGQNGRVDDRARFVMDRAHCRVFLAAAPLIPQEVVDTRQTAGG